jgi:formylglycine-generating enzyme required for sulfatase activity
VVQLETKLKAAKSNLDQALWASERKWIVNDQQQTMIACRGKDRPQIGHNFAIGACEVTIDQWRRFPVEITIDRTTAPTDDCPMHNVSWHEVARYCNWLSEQEGLPESEWVFEPNEDGIYGKGTRIRENFGSLRGYRLPTHEEWKLACNAGAKTWKFCFGTPIELADLYAWHGGNSLAYSHPVGSKLPNDFGIFDIHGNSWEWSLGSESGGMVFRVTSNKQPLYGGCFNSVRRNIQYYSNTKTDPNERSNYHSFRLARSLP